MPSARSRASDRNYGRAIEASVEELKQRARRMWATGNFDEISNSIPEVGITVVDHVAIEPGMTVLDVACGTGNATIPAAVAGGRCTGLDLTPELFEYARRHAAEAGVHIDWVEGDAEALPFASGSFDRVISTFGVMFAPRHEVAAAELARVVAPGGTIGLSCWTPEGTVGQMFKLVAFRMPQPASSSQPATLWGDEDYVRGLLGPHGLEVSCERQLAGFRSETIEALFDLLETNFGPWRMARAALGDRWSELRQPLFDLYASASEPVEPSGIASFSEYLLVLARKPV